MQAKNVIRRVVDWKDARKVFYWRMRRTLLEAKLSKDIESADSSLDWRAARGVVASWRQGESKTEEGSGDECGEVRLHLPQESQPNDDRAFVEWATREPSSIPARLAAIRQQSVTKQLQQLLASDAQGVLEGFLSVYRNLDPETKAKLAAGLK